MRYQLRCYKESMVGRFDKDMSLEEIKSFLQVMDKGVLTTTDHISAVAVFSDGNENSLVTLFTQIPDDIPSSKLEKIVIVCDRRREPLATIRIDPEASFHLWVESINIMYSQLGKVIKLIDRLIDESVQIAQYALA